MTADPSGRPRLPTLSLGVMVILFAIAALLVPTSWISSTQNLIASKLESQQRRQARHIFSQELAALDLALVAGDRSKKAAILAQRQTLLLRRFVLALPMNDGELEAVQRILPDLQGQLHGQSPAAIKALRRVHTRTLDALLPRATADSIAALLGAYDAQLEAL